MNELIKIEINENNEQVVSGRDLHEFLEISERYSSWFERMLQYGFEENVDYIGCKIFNTLARQELQDHLLKIPMAKEISMLQRNEKGKQARQYFIKCEEAWNSEEMVLARALQIQNRKMLDYKKQIVLLQEKIIEQIPKVEFYDAVIGSESTADMATVAKVLNYKGVGRNKLFEILREKGIIQKNNMPYQKYVDQGYFRIIETTYTDHISGDVKVSYKTVVFQKGIEYISKILKEQGYLKQEVA